MSQKQVESIKFTEVINFSLRVDELDNLPLVFYEFKNQFVTKCIYHISGSCYSTEMCNTAV